MLSCKQAAELICKAMDQPLSWRQRVALRFHLLLCKHCRGFDQQNQALLELFEKRFQEGAGTGAEQDLTLPEDVCDRLKERLHAAAKGEGENRRQDPDQ